MPEKSIVIELLTRIDLTTMHGSMPFSAWVGCHYAKVVGEKLPEYNTRLKLIIPPDVLDQALSEIFSPI